MTGSIIAGGMTDYVYRGVSLTGERATAALYGEVAAGMFYANALLVGNELGDDAAMRSIGNLEADLTVGIAPTVGNFTLNLGVKYTGYPNGRDIIAGTMRPAERDFVEFIGGVKVAVTDAVTIGMTGFYVPDFYYETGPVKTLEFQGSLALPAVLGVQSRLTSAVGIVRSDARDIVSPGHGYAYWNAGIEGTFDKVYFDLRYWDTDVSEIDAFKPRVALTLGLRIP